MSYKHLLLQNHRGRWVISGRALILALHDSRRDLDLSQITFKHSSDSDIRRVTSVLPGMSREVFEYRRDVFTKIRGEKARLSYSHSSTNPEFLSKEIKNICRPELTKASGSYEIKIYT